MNSEKEYSDKRDFTKTTEPKPSGDGSGEHPVFVIQKHDATNLHYDFRLEINGTLKSWSIPKGPSTDPREKRMAIPTEDHPLSYASFEGTIPANQYGGGTVMIWDRGEIENLKKDENGKTISLSKSYDKGTIEIYMRGKKIYGGYALIKMKSGNMKGNWLLIKMKDEQADARRNPVSTETKSVVSNRTMHQIANPQK